MVKTERAVGLLVKTPTATADKETKNLPQSGIVIRTVVM
jgi:hypothetical protein